MQGISCATVLTTSLDLVSVPYLRHHRNPLKPDIAEESCSSRFQNKSCFPVNPNRGNRNAYIILNRKRMPYMQRPIIKSILNGSHKSSMAQGAISSKSIGSYFIQTHLSSQGKSNHSSHNPVIGKNIPLVIQYEPALLPLA